MLLSWNFFYIDITIYNNYQTTQWSVVFFWNGQTTKMLKYGWVGGRGGYLFPVFLLWKKPCSFFFSGFFFLGTILIFIKSKQFYISLFFHFSQCRCHTCCFWWWPLFLERCHSGIFSTKELVHNCIYSCHFNYNDCSYGDVLLDVPRVIR